MAESVLVWLQKWYQAECDGDWEHENIISIESLDNPGWQVRIDLKYTVLENITIESIMNEVDDNDWWFFEIKNDVYRAAGDPNKLEIMLLKFKEIVEARL